VGGGTILSYARFEFQRVAELTLAPAAGWRCGLIVLDGVMNGNFDVVERGIHCFERVQRPPLAATASASPPAADVRLQFHDFSTGRVTTVARDLGLVGSGLSASRDGRDVFLPASTRRSTS
jgi:hypothetical protein